jgi:hypothetical protein
MSASNSSAAPFSNGTTAGGADTRTEIIALSAVGGALITVFICLVCFCRYLQRRTSSEAREAKQKQKQKKLTPQIKGTTTKSVDLLDPQSGDGLEGLLASGVASATMVASMPSKGIVSQVHETDDVQENELSEVPRNDHSDKTYRSAQRILVAPVRQLRIPERILPRSEWYYYFNSGQEARDSELEKLKREKLRFEELRVASLKQQRVPFPINVTNSSLRPLSHSNAFMSGDRSRMSDRPLAEFVDNAVSF